mmetsp:Transcript_5608/g.10583  ORF Transcript_5608/g.10583 Transcript_5608/m.10583 type:complete len:85 (+) Transcript_5608:246-500(+)
MTAANEDPVTIRCDTLQKPVMMGTINTPPPTPTKLPKSPATCITMHTLYPSTLEMLQNPFQDGHQVTHQANWGGETACSDKVGL